MSETTQKHSMLARLGRWLAELILVFVGVYAAFWLNNYQQGKEQAKRRDQILAYLEQRLEDGITSAKSDGAKEEKLIAAFKHSLDAGEMPPLRPFSFSTDYNPTDIATLLQSGGIELLDTNPDRAAPTRIDNSRRLECDSAFRETQRRTNRAQSRPGHFLLL